MKVRMKTLSAGPDGVLSPDQVVDVSPEKAKELVAGGFAEYASRAVETATVTPPENEALFPKRIGGSYYLLSDKTKVRGKAKAKEAQALLEVEEKPAEAVEDETEED